MSIIVIDNFKWTDEPNRAGFNTDAPFYYIVTSKITLSAIGDELNFAIELYNSQQSKKDKLIFLINVHCTFRNGRDIRQGKSYLQEQQGVVIYRHLLQVYERNQTDLRVAFFSPIAKDKLSKLKPEILYWKVTNVYQFRLIGIPK